MGTQTELALLFLLGGLFTVFIIFLLISIVIYAWHKSRKRRVHVENVTITNKNFDSHSRYSKTDTTDYIRSIQSPNMALTKHFHHGLGMSKKTFEAPSAPLTPPSSSSPTTTDDAVTTDIESTTAKINGQMSGSLRSVIVIDDETELPSKNVLPILAPIEKRPETTPRDRNFLIEIPKSNSRHSFSANGNRSPIESAATPRRFSQQMDNLQENENERLYSEFDNLNQKIELKASNDAQTLKNIRRNRYYDILPYDENRVKLIGLENDYINASYIKDSQSNIKYIAAQAPIGDSETTGGRRDNTLVEFWHMIWQEKIDCIVMLTQCFEHKRVMCPMYWPRNVDENEKIDDDLSMNLYCVTEDEICFIREIWLEKKNEGTRKIMQWQYKDWNDAEGPASNEIFLTFIENVRKSNKKDPILVHCSAGVGRTGVYIALDSLLNNLESESIIDVCETVQSLRKLRFNMVQNFDQYLTLYEMIALAIRNKFKANESK